MVVTCRVPSPRSVRYLLQVTSVSASAVGKRVLHVKHRWSASSRAPPRQLERSNSVAMQASVKRSYRIVSITAVPACDSRENAPRLLSR